MKATKMTEVNLTKDQIWKVEESGSFYIPITTALGEKCILKINDFSGCVTDENAAKFLDHLHMGLNIAGGFKGTESHLAMNGLKGLEIEGAIKVEDYVHNPQSELDVNILLQTR